MDVNPLGAAGHRRVVGHVAEVDLRRGRRRKGLAAQLERTVVEHLDGPRSGHLDAIGVRGTVGVHAGSGAAGGGVRQEKDLVLPDEQIVALRAVDPQATWRCQGVLLNLSEHGLACRVSPEEDTSSLRQDMALRLSFQVRSEGPVVEVEARVVNVTPLEAGGRILGMEFRPSASFRTLFQKLAPPSGMGRRRLMPARQVL